MKFALIEYAGHTSYALLTDRGAIPLTEALDTTFDSPPGAAPAPDRVLRRSAPALRATGHDRSSNCAWRCPTASASPTAWQDPGHNRDVRSQHGAGSAAPGHTQKRGIRRWPGRDRQTPRRRSRRVAVRPPGDARPGHSRPRQRHLRRAVATSRLRLHVRHRRHGAAAISSSAATTGSRSPTPSARSAHASSRSMTSPIQLRFASAPGKTAPQPRTFRSPTRATPSPSRSSSPPPS